MRSSIPVAGLALSLAACTTPAPPAEPPTRFAAPPPVTGGGYVDSFATATTPLSVPELRAFLRERPFITFFRQQGSIAPPVETTILSGTWPEPGAVRRLKQADGHYVVERVLENREDFFSYQVWGFTGQASRGLEYIVGEQRFTPAENGGSTFTWTYRLKPRNALTAFFVRRQREAEVQPFMDGAVERMASAAAESRGVSVAQPSAPAP